MQDYTGCLITSWARDGNGMIESIAQRVAKITSQQQSLGFKVLSLVGGGILFVVLIPFLLGIIGRSAAGTLLPREGFAIRYSVGIPAIAVGLGILIWAVKAFWSLGAGTPVPVAAPQRLVTKGPYRYCRNPIQLGAMILYFGMGTVADSTIIGVIMFGFALILGTVYHRHIEEKELQLRFGAEYEEYRRATPFLLPRFGRHQSKERPNNGVEPTR